VPRKLRLGVNDLTLSDRAAQRGQAPDARFKNGDLRIKFGCILDKAAALRRAVGWRYIGKHLAAFDMLAKRWKAIIAPFQPSILAGLYPAGRIGVWHQSANHAQGGGCLTGFGEQGSDAE
jgi:hypothetical protein